VYEKAKSTNPIRWPGKIRNWDHIKAVMLNPEKPAAAQEQAA